MPWPYSYPMIKSFTDKGLQLFWETGSTRKLAVQNPKRIKLILDMLHAAEKPSDMDVPGLRWHNLAPSQPSRYTVMASGNYRVTFAFEKGHAVDVDLEDYH
jgi:proteic killer suppression protein